jgi:hypothetical protein
MRRHTLGLGLFIALSVSTAATAKDVTLRQRTTTSGPASRTTDAMQYWTAGKMVTDDAQQRSIIDLVAKTITVADKTKKTYFTQTFAELQQQLDTMKEQIRKQMDNLPPQAREMMAKMGGNPMAKMDAPVTLKPTGKSEKIAGYDAKEYAIEGGMTGSVWVTEAIQLPMAAADATAFAKSLGGTGGSGAKFGEALVNLKALPLRTTFSISMGPQTMSTTTEVIEVAEKAPPADVLKVPDGFTKVTAPAAGPHPGMGH